jgi:hypothetical protein
VNEETFENAKTFTTAIMDSSNEFSKKILVESGMSPVFERLVGRKRCERKLGLQLLYQWVKFVRCHDLEARLM